eukprot:1153372-Pelagomonas_calceolata.AAC.1
MITKALIERPCGAGSVNTGAGNVDSMLRSNSETLRRVLKVDLNIHSLEPACWTAQSLGVFQVLRRYTVCGQCGEMLRECTGGTHI